MNASRLAVAVPLVAVATFAAGYGLGALRGGGPAEGLAAGESGAGASGGAAGAHPPGMSALPTRRGAAATVLPGIARDGKLGMFVKLRAYVRLAHTTPADELEGLLRELEREVPEDLGAESLAAIIGRRWATEDPEAAMAALLAGDPRILDEAQGAVLGAAAAADPDGTWELIMGMGTAERKEEMLRSLLAEMVKHDLEGTLERVVSMETPNLYRSPLRACLGQAAQLDPVATLEALDRLPRGLVGWNFYFEAFEVMARQDAAAAARRLEALRDPWAREGAARGLAKVFVASDPADARAWAAELPTVRERDTALVTILSEWSRSAPAEAALALAEIRSPRQRADSAPLLASRWFRADPDAALEWAGESLEGNARQGAFRGLLRDHGRDLEFERQLQLAEEITGEGRERRDFVERWARSDPAAASEWAVKQGPKNDALTREAMTEWADRDFAAAEDFAEGIEDERLRKTAMAVVERKRQYLEAEGGDGD